VRACTSPAVRLHHNLAQIYRDKAARLHEELNRPELREEASAAIRSLIEGVRLVPVDGKLEIELAGALAGILALTSNNHRRVGRGLQVTLVAGARNHLYRTAVQWPQVRAAFMTCDCESPWSSPIARPGI